MTLTRRTVILGATALGTATLAGCARTPDAPDVPGGPITLTDVFVGEVRGRGVFHVDLTGSERRFSAQLHGRLEGDRLTVAEDFTYDDGQTGRLTWVFDRAGPGRWTGRRDDTVGVAEVVEEGDTIRLTYTADFESLEGVTRLAFSDVIYRAPDGRVINEAIVRRWGLPVGRVRFEMTRV
ncbi:DUF3833 domain-containing protein [Pararhodobacter zhoushanensis]|uniref:DUF3833 domain-containing protein n=1 Tax=Pararhodobacter zhoushanensis TaxID=2479545 RepID=A0ABT3H3B5_9RHOB|nr:DUF3833 domain-containing protein [Pararhodobacter zhoushanensis]MCW1934296.1 DUF3833 domain-containing protein [Pararhodobacter zhoushanensis]